MRYEVLLCSVFDHFIFVTFVFFETLTWKFNKVKLAEVLNL